MFIADGSENQDVHTMAQNSTHRIADSHNGLRKNVREFRVAGTGAYWRGAQP
jgi:hypothetical protein